MREKSSTTDRGSRRTQVCSVMELNPSGDPSWVISALDHRKLRLLINIPALQVPINEELLTFFSFPFSFNKLSKCHH